jgi:hypothetical protein
MKFDALEPRRKKVAIVGFASSTRLQAPFDDQSWEIWAMNQLMRFIPRGTRWFEMHPHSGPHSYVADMVPGTDYLKWMRECPIPLYMVSRREDFPTSITYPLDQMLAEFGTDYFHSTVDYMLALAISEGFEEIGIWGIDMAHDTEYEHQKPSGSFWIGVAKGRGIKVTIPPESALLHKAHRYGYEPLPSDHMSEQLAGRAKALHERRAQLATEMNAIDGALQENGHWAEFVKHQRRGALLVPAK